MSLITTVAGPNSESYITLVEANDYIASRPGTNWNDVDYLERERLLRQSTAMIDLHRFKGTKLFTGEGGGLEFVVTSNVYNYISYAYQRLSFPRSFQERYQSYPDSGSTTTLVDATFSDALREDDYFNYGSIFIVSGTNKGEYRDISDYAKATGTFTVSSAFTLPIDSSSQYLILSPIDRYVKYATVEQAVYLSDNLELENLKEWRNAKIISRSIGDVSIRFSDGTGYSRDGAGWICANSYKYLRKFIDKSKGTGRA